MATVLAVSVLLAACGSGSSSSGPPPGHPGPAPTAQPTPAPTSPSVPPPTPGDPPPLRLGRVASGLDRPLYVASPPGDGSRLVVLEQTGRIRLIEDGALREQAFLDLSGEVSCCGERGLLGLAFHPSHADNGRLYVNYTDREGDTVIAEYTRSASDPAQAGPEPSRVLFRQDQPFPNHNGGMLAFGPDGFLYIGLGDGGSGGDPFDNAQNLATKLGKILRIDVDDYPTPPPGNVQGGDPDVWAYGLRNPWRFSFDRATGELYVGDVGQNLYEEIHVAPAGQGGQNYGWPTMEGLHCFEPRSGCDQSGLLQPAVEYGRDGGCSVTGGYVYRGSAIPGLVGRYLYADYCTDRIWSFRWQNGVATAQVELTLDLDPDEVLGGVASFGEDAAGELYIASLDGNVYRIEAE